METPALLLSIATLLPLAAFGFLLFFGKRMGNPFAGYFGTAAIGGSFLCSVAATFFWLSSNHVGTSPILLKRNAIGILMGVELVLNAANVNLVAFNHYAWRGSVASPALDGQIFAIFVITDAVAEAAVGLGILIALFRNKETVLADEIDLLKW